MTDIGSMPPSSPECCFFVGCFQGCTQVGPPRWYCLLGPDDRSVGRQLSHHREHESINKQVSKLEVLYQYGEFVCIQYGKYTKWYAVRPF